MPGRGMGEVSASIHFIKVRLINTYSFSALLSTRTKIASSSSELGLGTVSTSLQTTVLPGPRSPASPIPVSVI